MLTKGDSSGAAVVPRKGKMAGLRIIQRHHFTAQLKRMAVVAGFTTLSGEVTYISAVKGAPETIREMLHTVPPGYDNTYKTLSKRGARVLALGRKELGRLAHAEVRSLTRGDLENNLTFAGFIIISCPLKRDSKEVIREILHSSHAAVILTGDNYLTACHVANELKFTQKSAILVLQAKEKGSKELSENLSDREGQWAWQDLDGSLSLSVSLSEVGLDVALKKYDLCVTGEGLSYLHTAHPSLLKSLLPAVRIFARVAPKQKELVITLYKDLKFTTLMCGDGTNDVGALKHAHCGVAILSGAPDRPSSGLRRVRQAERQAERQTDRPTERRGRRNAGGKTSVNTASQNSALLTPQQEQVAKLQKLLQELEQDSNLIVKLGDASIAAPFTSKLSSIQCVCHIIKQGRCTLVTTLQMFKILALNALILAYSQSVLYLDGIKFSDYQATLQGLLLAGCFLFISRSKPLPELSRTRPLPNIFNLYTISTVLLQFASHFWCLVYLVSVANDISPKRSGAVELEKEFEPNLINSTVYIISLSLQISTFAINYRGRPFMESLKDNKPLLYCLICAFSLVICLTVGVVPEFSRQFEIIEFPEEFRVTLLKVLTADFSLSLAADRLCLALFGEGGLPSSLTHASL
uniref:Cation-transporting P-type ATPase C-terminal domain-containing protein n=1 Tax=Scylla olivacea TaxID=85551 RepID=A0A0P4W6M4_SCYOL